MKDYGIRRVAAAGAAWALLAAGAVFSQQAAAPPEKLPPLVTSRPAEVPKDIEAVPRERAVVIQLKGAGWEPTTWAGEGDAECSKLTEVDGWPRIRVDEPNRWRIWHCQLGAPIEIKRYPIAVMTYRARGDWTSGNTRILSFTDELPTSDNFIVTFRRQALATDGKTYQVTADLRRIGGPGSSVTGICLAAAAGPKGPAELDLLDLRLLAPEDAPAQAVKEDKPITLKVVGKDGKPLAGAKVTVDADRANWARSAETNPDGVATVTPLVTETGRHSLLVEKEGMAPARFGRADRPNQPLPEQVTLEKGVELGGVVQDEDGKPVARASVQMMALVESRLYRSLTLLTDEKGRWRTPLLPEGMREPSIRVSHPGFIKDEYYSSSRMSMDQLRAKEAVWTVKRGMVLEGVVVDADAKPIKGATVQQGGDRFGTSFPGTVTDEQGRFRFANARPGAATLTITAPNFAPALQQVTVAPKTEPLRVPLEKGRTLRGRVIDPQDRPVAQAYVVADTWRGCRSLGWSTRTDEQGRFVWTSAPPDAVMCDILKQGYMDLRNQPLTASEEERIIRLSLPLRVTGRVLDAETGKPVAKFQVIPGIDWGGGQPADWERRAGKPFADGKYELPFTFPRDGHYVRIEAEGYKPAASRVIRSDEGEVTIDFKLEKGQPITGVVLQPDGAPAVGADVLLDATGHGLYMQNGQVPQGPYPSVKTDAQGRFSFSPQDGPCPLVVLHAAGFATIDGAEAGKGQEIRLSKWGRIEGTVMAGTKPLANESIRGYSQGAHWRSAANPQEAINQNLTATTDKDGHFAIDRVVPGTFYVGRGVQVGNTGMYSHARRLEVAAGETAKVTIGGTGRPVVGQLVAPAEMANPPFAQMMLSARNEPERPKPPKPPEGLSQADQRAWLEKWRSSDEGKAYAKAVQEAEAARRNYCTGVAADGRFRFEDVEAGVYVMEVRVEAPMPDTTGRVFVTTGFAGSLGRHPFIVPEIPGGRSDEPLDLGRVKLQATQPAVPSTVTSRPSAPPEVPSAPTAEGPKPLLGKPLPSLEPFGLPAPAVTDKPSRRLVCFWDADQRPSRQAVANLNKQGEELARRGLKIVLIHVGDEKKAKDWLAANKVTLASGAAPAGKAKQVSSDWAVQRLPWLILADEKSVIRAEGIGPAELTELLDKQDK